MSCWWIYNVLLGLANKPANNMTSLWTTPWQAASLEADQIGCKVLFSSWWISPERKEIIMALINKVWIVKRDQPRSNSGYQIIPVNLTLDSCVKWDQRCTYLNQRFKKPNENMFKYFLESTASLKRVSKYHFLPCVSPYPSPKLN